MAWLSPLNPPMRHWQGQSVWVIGASSGIGRATAAALHALGARVTVSARKEAALQAFVAEHPGSVALVLDSTDRAAMHTAAQHVLAQQPLDCVVYCAGAYQPMRADAMDVDVMQQHLRVNYEGALFMLESVLAAMRQRGQGHISLVSSVAGYRGLSNSLAYGPTKAALTNLAENLHLDVHRLGLGVSVINPGFVDTPLTAQNHFTMPALLTPAQAAQAIVQGWAQGRFEIHFPRRFTIWMQLLRILPDRWYFYFARKTTT